MACLPDHAGGETDDGGGSNHHVLSGDVPGSPPSLAARLRRYLDAELDSMEQRVATLEEDTSGTEQKLLQLTRLQQLSQVQGVFFFFLFFLCLPFTTLNRDVSTGPSLTPRPPSLCFSRDPRVQAFAESVQEEAARSLRETTDSLGAGMGAALDDLDGRLVEVEARLADAQRVESELLETVVADGTKHRCALVFDVCACACMCVCVCVCVCDDDDDDELLA